MDGKWRSRSQIFTTNLRFEGPNNRLEEEEGLGVTRQSSLSFLKCYRETHTIGRWPGNGRPSVISEEVKKIVEAQMQVNLKFKGAML